LSKNGPLYHLTEPHADHPEIGEQAYNDMYCELASSPYHGANTAADNHPVKGFTPLLTQKPAYIPEDAQYFVSKKQAYDIEVKAPKESISIPNLGSSEVNYLFTVFGAFNPDVIFYYDDYNLTPNAYSFRLYGKQFVVVNAGLIYLQDLSFPGLAMIIAHELGHLGKSNNMRNGYSCEGEADYSIANNLAQIFFYPAEFRQTFLSGYDQVKKIFSYISPENQKGCGSKCNDIGISCRLKSIYAGFAKTTLPHCAGGPSDPALDVVDAVASIANNQYKVTVMFNMAVDAESATLPANYGIGPDLLGVISAEMDIKDPTVVILTVDNNAKTDYEYTVTVTNVLSAVLHNPLKLGESTATFTFKSPKSS
jgi:hypothetical protein